MKRETGFTLLELMVSIGIVAILLAIGVPSFRYVTTANRVSAEVNGLLGDLQFARAEAIKEGQTVTVCASTDGGSCAGGSSWTGGWIVFSDHSPLGSIEGDDTTLRIQKPLSSGDTFAADNGIGAVTFNREGFAMGMPAGSAKLTLQDSTATPAYTRCLSITIVGALTTQQSGQTTAEGNAC